MANDSQITLIAVPASIDTGDMFPVRIQFKNTGDTVWIAGAYKLGSQGPQDNDVWGFNRVALSNNVAPGDVATFNFTPVAPANPGIYTFSWRMVQEFVQWFGATASSSISVIGNPPPPPQPPPKRSDPMDLTSFLPFPYFFYPAASTDDRQSKTWTNTTGRTLKIRKAYLWTGIDLNGVCDTDVEVRRQSDSTLVAKVAWDHYSNPTAESGKIFDFGPNYVTVLPGEVLVMNYMTHTFGGNFNAAHRCELWIEG